MLDLLLKLIEQLTKLVAVQEEDRAKYFQTYVQPTYDSAEAVYRDYRDLLRKLRQMLTKRRHSKPIIDFLEQRREELLPARNRLRALVARRVKEGRGTRFEAGVLGIMTGAATGTDTKGHFEEIFYKEEDDSIHLYSRDHTVLDILQSMTKHDVRDFSGDRSFLLRLVDKKMDAIEDAWQNVVNGYADLQAKALPPARLLRNSVLKRRQPSRSTASK